VSLKSLRHDDESTAEPVDRSCDVAVSPGNCASARRKCIWGGRHVLLPRVKSVARIDRPSVWAATLISP